MRDRRVRRETAGADKVTSATVAARIDLAIRVLRDGRLIVEHDRSARIRFEVRARNETFDLEPILRRERAGRQVSA